MSGQHEQAVQDEFSHQADAFAHAAVMRSAATLHDLVADLPLGPRDRWVDVATGPGIVAQALAAHVAEVVGVDTTVAMVAKATAEARSAGVRNVRFLHGDATALPLTDGDFDGALIRFALHHIPAPWRVLGEMARVVRPGGWVVAADHLTSAEGAVAAWHQEIERLRDPSHWACLPPEALFALGAEFGLRLERRRLVPFALDYREWLERGSGGPAQRELIRKLLQRAPDGAGEVFAVQDGRLALLLGVAVWQRPA